MARDLRFQKARRLTRTAEFDRVRKEGRRAHGQLLSLGVLLTNENERMRAGFITSRKLGGAVVRNRVRRRLREIVRHHQHEIVDGTWVVIIASPGAARAGYSALEAEWLRLAKRASILAP
jgi:ribonuclease P protein component